MNKRPTIPLLRDLSLVALLVGCGLPATPTDVKFAGVGLDPEEIGPSPSYYGGVIEYDYVNFAGAGLPLGLMGLVSYDEVGPGFSNMKPPYAMVTGTAFIMDSDLPATDTLFGTFGTPSPAVGTCYTNYEPRAYLNNTADAGDHITLASTDDSDYFEYTIGRRPSHWLMDNQEALFTYYMDLDAYQSEPLYALAPGASGSLENAEKRLLKAPNYKHGAEVEVSFPGGLPPHEAPVASIPMPLAADDGNHRMMLPNEPMGVMLSWVGPVYDAHGEMLLSGGDVADGGGYRTCFQYLRHDESPVDPADCLTLQEPPFDPDTDFEELVAETTSKAQMYTGPWDTEGGVTLQWLPAEAPVEGESVTVSVRFLGPVDTDDKYKREALVPVEDEDGFVGYREATACEQEGDDFQWEVDPGLLKEDGSFIDSLQGEPTHTLAEVTCTVPDTGEFTITSEIIENAMDYALRHDAQGAVFYMTRTTATDIDTPPVRDKDGQRRDISAIRATSASAVIGRFWWDL